VVDVPELHRRAVEGFGRQIHAVGEDQWNLPTPCPDWDVRTLCNHLVNESLWTPPLMAGQTIEEVGDRFDGDVLGEDPKKSWDESARAAMSAVQQDGAMERMVHLSFGDVPGREYVLQLFADYLIHSWDLARAIGGDEKLEPELVDECARWFESMEAAYRAGGAIGERPEVPDEADPQTRLLAMFGRRA
jgi:uncharacterized protein (TIGR03086 family)